MKWGRGAMFTVNIFMRDRGLEGLNYPSLTMLCSLLEKGNYEVLAFADPADYPIDKPTIVIQEIPKEERK
jgi:hypothetical protein